MADKSILKLSLISSIAGILLLYVSAAHMKPSLTPISKVDEDFVGLSTKVSGKVIDIRGASEGHLFLKIKDESGGVITVPIFSKINSKLEKQVELLDNIEVQGKVENYEGQLEIIPKKPESVQIVHSTPLELSKVDKSKLGKIVKTKGYIAEKKIVGNGNLLIKLTEKDENITVFIPQIVVNTNNFPEIQEGKIIQIAGPVQLYEGKLEMKVENPQNIEVIGDHQ